jgi:hypothetical protein
MLIIVEVASSDDHGHNCIHWFLHEEAYVNEVMRLNTPEVGNVCVPVSVVRLAPATPPRVKAESMSGESVIELMSLSLRWITKREVQTDAEVSNIS